MSAGTKGFVQVLGFVYRSGVDDVNHPRCEATFKISSFFFLVFVLAMLLSVHPLYAETVRDAMASAYMNNPQLRADRARQRATDENVSQARAGYRPTIGVEGQMGSTKIKSKPSQLSDDRFDPHGYSISVTQPLFRGFQTVNAIRGAKAGVEAGRHELRLVEQTILNEAASAYLTLVRAEAVLKLRNNNAGVLLKQLEATRTRFKVGEVTKTDVAQAEATYSAAKSLISVAASDVKAAEAEYRRVVGINPRTVFKSKRLHRYLPHRLKDALHIGANEHPSILSAAFSEKAALHEIDRIKGEQLPQVNLEASYDKFHETSRFVDDRETTTVTGRVSIPLYQGGQVYSRIRQAKQIALQRRAQVQQAQDQVRSNITASWSRYKAFQAQLVSARAEVKARETAVNGVRAEEKVGQRTVLNVLEADQNLLDAQVNLVTAEINLLVSEYNLLNSIGRLEAALLHLPIDQYDPYLNYQKVDRKWRGDEIGHRELDARRATKLDVLRDAFRRLNGAASGAK